MTQEQRQAHLDKVWQWFVVDKHQKSVDGQGGCRYLAPGGARCAFAVIVPEELQDTLAEGNGAVTLLGVRPDLANAIGYDYTEADHDFVCALQYAHDAAARMWGIHEDFLRHVELRLRDLARDFELQVPA